MIIFLTISLSFLYVAIWLLMEYWSRDKKKLLRQFNYVEEYPIAGHIPRILKNPLSFFKLVTNIGIEMDYLAAGMAFGKAFLFVADPETFKLITNKLPNNKGLFNSFIKSLMGDGLITIEDRETWKKHRRYLSPLFNIERMSDKYMQSINRVTEMILEDLDDKAKQNLKVDSWMYFNKWQMKSISCTVFGRDISDNDAEILFENAAKLHKTIFRRFFIPLLWIKNINDIYEYLFGLDKYHKKIYELIKKHIGEHRLKKHENRTLNDDREYISFFDLLLHKNASELYTEKNIEDEISTMYDAGSVTIGTVINYTLLMLAIHEDHQEHVYQEILNVLGSDKFIRTREQLNKLKFLEQCINESMRLFTPITGIIRQPEEDLKLKGGKIIPKGTIIFLLSFLMHKNKHQYSNPETWDPHRFEESEINKRHPGSFQPFGAGPRMCAGIKYSYMSLKMQLATILYDYRAKTDLTMSEIQDGLYTEGVLKNSTLYSLFLQHRDQRCINNN